MSRVAIVTGANKGIGFAIVKSLAKKFDGILYLTARNEELGQKAVKELDQHGIKVGFHQLDIDDINSINRFAGYIKNKYGGVDILINNAAIAYKNADPAPFSEQAINTIRINFTGTLNMCNAFFPLLRPHARVVNVSSRAGMLKVCKRADLRDKLTNKNAAVEDVASVMHEFVEAAKNGTNEPIATTAYGMSKVGVTAMSIIQQRLLAKDPRQDIIVNACCPGYVSTDMSSFKGPLTPEQGAETPVYLALLEKNVASPKGELVAEKNILDWADLNWVWKLS